MNRHRLGPVALTLASVLVASLSAGCSDNGQLVLGIATDLLARGQINRVAMEVRRSGEQTPIVSYKWDLAGVPAEDYRLPGSFTLVADGGQEPTFEVTVRGQIDDRLVVERRSMLGVLAGRDLFIRLGLIGACEEIGCPGSLACIEGQCRPMAVDLHTLPAYRASLIERLDCDSGTRFVDTGTGAPMPSDTTCQSGSLCGEGVCLVDPVTLPAADPRPFIGGPAELFASARMPGAFFAVGPLDAARFHASATLLKDGRVLVVGGATSAAIDGSAQHVPGAVVYDPVTASFRRLSDPPASLTAHTATRIEEGPSAGNVIFVGTAAPVGSTPGLATAFEFDPATNQFSPLPAPNARRFFHTTSLLSNNKLLVYGGTSASGGALMPVGGAELYDLATRSWSITKVGPVRTRAFHTATALPDGRILFAGGIDMSGNPLAEAEAYDPTQDAFFGEISLRRPRAVHTATALSDGSILLVGGQGDQTTAALDDAELYVPGGHTAIQQPTLPPLARTAHSAVLLEGDRVLFVGGTSAFETGLPRAAGGAFVYDHATRSFSRLPDPQRARLKGFAVRLADGDVLVGGGNAEVAPGSDGGVPLDATVVDDLSITYCDPAALLGTKLCGGATPRCGVVGQRAYGPRFTTTSGPACTAEGSIPFDGSCAIGGEGGDLGVSGDDCVSGSLCMPDEADVLRCMRTCRVDMDCPQTVTVPMRSTCARILSGPGLSDVGVCMYPCGVFNVEDCMVNGGICRYALNQVNAAAPVQAVGVCMSAGANPVGTLCTRDNYVSECSLNESCIAGRCEYLCDDQTRCDQNYPGSKCSGLASGFPSTGGFCQQGGDMGTGAIDMTAVGLDF